MSSTTSQPALSVIIPSYRMASALRRCLLALGPLDTEGTGGTEGGVEIIVVDSSGDGSVAALHIEFPHVLFVTPAQRTFAAAARNLGAARARGRALAFLDADCVPCPGWLARSVEVAARSHGVTAGPVVPAPPHSVAGLVLFLVEFAEHLPRGARTTTFAPSCNLVVSRDAWRIAGPFPEELARSHDLAWAERLIEPIHVDPAIEVAHAGPTALRDVVAHLHRLGVWSARARAHSPSLRGSFLVRSRVALFAPLLAPLLVPWRMARILTRVAVARDHRWLFALAVVAAPLLAAALVVWAAGFARGAAEKRSAAQRQRPSVACP